MCFILNGKCNETKCLYKSLKGLSNGALDCHVLSKFMLLNMVLFCFLHLFFSMKELQLFMNLRYLMCYSILRKEVAFLIPFNEYIWVYMFSNYRTLNFISPNSSCITCSPTWMTWVLKCCSVNKLDASWMNVFLICSLGFKKGFQLSWPTMKTYFFRRKMSQSLNRNS